LNKYSISLSLFAISYTDGGRNNQPSALENNQIVYKGSGGVTRKQRLSWKKAAVVG
jgi:hypothetical protein